MFASLRHVLGDSIFFRLKPDWKAAQAEEVETRLGCRGECVNYARNLGSGRCAR